ncbi:Bgt-20058, partial [Blumeria graminis f. sp. tritici]
PIHHAAHHCRVWSHSLGPITPLYKPSWVPLLIHLNTSLPISLPCEVFSIVRSFLSSPSRSPPSSSSPY